MAPSLASTALALTALAGGVVALSSGEAKALTCDFANGGLIPGSCSDGKGEYDVWHETNIAGSLMEYPTDKDILFVEGPTAGKGQVTWYWQDVNMNGTWLIPPDPHSVDEWHVDVDFDPDLMASDLPAGETNSLFEYAVIIDKGLGGDPHLPYNPWFEDVTLSAMFGPPPIGGGQQPSYVTKEIYSINCPDNPMSIYECSQGSLIDILTVNPTMGMDYIDITALQLDKLYIVDKAYPRDNDIDAYQNIYRQVPGPLPILGSGAGFLFSRKLRRRIRASRVA